MKLTRVQSGCQLFLRMCLSDLPHLVSRPVNSLFLDAIIVICSLEEICGVCLGRGEGEVECVLLFHLC